MIWTLLACIPEPGKSVHDPDHDFDGDGLDERQGDCDDGDSAIGAPGTWFLDADGDGYAGSEAITACEPPSGAFSASDDCDDTRSDTFPGAPDPCDALDQGCDGAAPEELDGDGDGWVGCQDCDDTDDTIYPGQLDPCDGVDQSCDGGLCEPHLLLREEHAELALPADPGQGGVLYASGQLVGVGSTSRQLPRTAAPTARLIVAPSFEVIEYSFLDVGEHASLAPVGDVTGDAVTDWLAASYCYQGGCAGETESYAVLLDGAQLEGGTLGSEGRLVGPVGSCVGLASAPLDGGFALSGACADEDEGIVWVVSAPLDPSEDLDLSTVPAMRGEPGVPRAPGFTMASGDLQGDGALDLAVGNYGYGGMEVFVVQDAMAEPVAALSDAPMLSSELFTHDNTGKGTLVLFFPDPGGAEQLVIGAPGNYEQDAGHVYVGAPPITGPFSAAPVEVVGDASFGAALADLGDIDGDGVHDLAIGEPDGDDFAPDSTSGGFVRVISGMELAGSGVLDVEQVTLLVVEGEADAHLGVSLAGGDLDGDGRGDLVVAQEDPVVGPAVLVFTDLLSE